MKSSSYMNRALRARDPRYAQILGKLGYARADIVPRPVEIPADWAALSWPGLRSLAAKVSKRPIRSKKDAITALEEEIERRG